jgi:hypothetical protein
MRGAVLLSAALAVAAGCGHLGIKLDGVCSAAAGALDAAEEEVISAAARSLYDEGDLRLARETALEDIWPHRLRALHLEETTLRVPSEAVDDLERRNERSVCLRFPEQELEVYPTDPGARLHLTVSRPGFDAAGNTALLVYRLNVGGHLTAIEARYLVLRKVPKRGWGVVNAIRKLR